MSENRFERCKTLVDLYNVFATDESVLDYNTLTDDELERLAIVFEANIPNKAEMPDTPLTEAGYECIYNIVVETVNENMEDEEMENNTVKGNVDAAVEEMMGKFAQAKENIKVKAGETADEYFGRVDDSLNVVKGAFGDVLDVADRLLGYSFLKENILAVLEAGNPNNNLFDMAAECRKRTDKYIAKVRLLGNSDDADKLEVLFTNIKGESIFTMFFSTLNWIAKKITRKLRKWFQVDEEKSVVGSICRSLSGFASVLRAGIKIVWNTAKFAASFIVAGVIIAGNVIVNAIKFVVTKIKGWTTKKDEVVEDDEEEEII